MTAAGLALLVLWGSSVSGQSVQTFFEDFESGNSPFDFSGAHPQGSFWTLSMLPTGGWNGSRGAQLTINSGSTQENIGWYNNGTRTFGKTPVTGDMAAIRFRIYFDPSYRWEGGGDLQNKLVDFGSPNRVIIMLERFDAYSPCNGFSNLDVSRGSLMVKTGINPPCAGPRGNLNSKAVMTNGRWIHVQVLVQSGSNGFYKIYVDNNNINAPDEQITGINVGVGGWTTFGVGGYWNGPASGNRTFRLDDVSVGLAFDSNWYPDGGGDDPPPAPPPPPGAPSGLRLSQSGLEGLGLSIFPS
jgi:hypothetical protein